MAEFGLQSTHDKSWHARDIARRAGADRPLSPVMQAAVTACELAHANAVRDAELRSR